MARLELNLFGNVMLDIILPQRELRREGGYPVLWLLHDYGGAYDSWGRYSRLELLARDREIAVVCPGSANGYFVDKKTARTDLAGIYTYLLACFPLSQRREDHYVAGVGMGGYGAVRAVLDEPERFGTAVSVDGELSAPELFAAGRPPHLFGGDVFLDANGRQDPGASLLERIRELRPENRMVLISTGADEYTETMRAAAPDGCHILLETGKNDLRDPDRCVRRILSEIP